MYKLMIVDDDYWTRQYLKNNVKWDEYGFILVREAENGEEALAGLKQDPVDLLISDIKMPVMDGIELSETVIRKFPGTEIILLSGHREFEYARKAVSLGVLDYVVKPIQDEALLAVVQKAVARLEENAHAMADEMQKQARAAQAAPLVKKRIISRLLNTRLEMEEIEKSLKILDLALKLEDQYVAILCEIDHYAEIVRNTGMENAGRLKIMVSELVQDILLEFADGTVIESDGSRFTCILSFDGNMDVSFIKNTISVLCEKIRRQIADSTGITITLGIGDIYRGIWNLFYSYHQACEAMTNKFFYGSNSIIAYNSNEKPSNTAPDFTKKYEGVLIGAVLSCNRSLLQSSMQRLKEELASGIWNDHNYIRHFIIHLIEKLVDEIQACRVLDHKNIYDIYTISMRISKTETLAEILDVFKGFLDELTGLVEDQNRNNSEKLIRDVINYIRQGYEKDLFVDEVARVFNVHPSYLSRTFKKETGENMLQYIMKVRIEKSKQLLTNPGLKISNIAFDIGYENERTFTRIFKKLEGMTPTEFRERAAKKAKHIS